MTDDALPGFHPDPSTPRLPLPPGACDAHVHVYGPQSQFPFAADRTFTPGDAPKETLFALHARLGITRCVVVQSGAHGFDNRVVADALAAKGAPTAASPWSGRRSQTRGCAPWMNKAFAACVSTI